ncbi:MULTISPECIES: type VI secretion system tube protein TssD [Pedobacter]|uniref:Uncharacterized protein n=1 Tax=Pedobacter zeae TaxID=1737356 RepID=A0A7W6KBQ5_9SPHI|nr:type VI secretion system tube protein TssD [Pedobacter zeae]MBB4107657.1 hypothetical protein [Pedobacter zeae]GGG97914.1 hypothetical protein GCM10007422_09920 [Pedobacter zeae]
MKTKWYNKVLIVFLLLCSFNALAQNETQAEIELKLTDNATNMVHSYKLYGASYSLTNPFYQRDGKLINHGNCSINIELGQDPDELLLKWMAGLLKNTSGVITMVTLNKVQEPRKMTFTDGRLAASSESFFITGNGTSPQMSFYVKTLTVDGTTVFSE